MSFFGALARNQIFGSKDGQVVTYVRVNTACIALIGHCFLTGEVWKTSKNDFRNRECPNIGRVRESLQGCKDVCMVKQGCTGFNYNHKTRSCVMRGCSLPVEPPARNYHDGYNAFWLASGFWRSGLLFACTLRHQNCGFCEFMKKPPLINFLFAY